jgi:tetratricopeptide (TPR) repeat protein
LDSKDSKSDNQQNYYDAIRYLKDWMRLKALDPIQYQRSSRFYIYFGHAYTKLNAMQEAFNAYKQALALNPTDLVAQGIAYQGQANARWQIKQRDLVGARDDYNKAIKFYTDADRDDLATKAREALESLPAR